MLGLFLFLHLAWASPLIHDFWHGDDVAHQPCDDPDCVVQELARGTVDFTPSPALATAPHANPIAWVGLPPAPPRTADFHGLPPGRAPPAVPAIA